MKNRDKIIIGTTLGVAAMTTLLFTTKKGKKIRKEICNQSEKLVADISEKIKEETQIKSFDDIANQVMNYAVKNKDSLSSILSNFFAKK